MPKYIEEREYRSKRVKPVEKLSRKVLRDKITSLERKRVNLINQLVGQDSDALSSHTESLVFMLNNELFTLRKTLEAKETK